MNFVVEFLKFLSKEEVDRAVIKIFFFLLFCAKVNAQNKNVQVNFTPTFKSTPISLIENNFQTQDSLKSEITVLKFYISNIRFIKNRKIVTQDAKTYLIDMGKTNSGITQNNISDFDAIQFDLGIDSITNVSGALGGDLDPTKGMYWTWQSGYINFKLEGYGQDKEEFTYHLGGYASPFNCIQTIQLKCSGDKINIGLDIATFLADVELQKTHQIMSPSNQAVQLSKNLAQLFYIIP